MANDQGPVVQSALLRSDLIRLRKDSGMTQEQVAQHLDWSPSKLIRVEGGRSSVTKVDLDALLSLYGITSESQRERLQALNRGAKERAWWLAYRDGINATYLDYVGYEAGAAFIRQYVGGPVPGLLQTPEYADVLTANSVDARRVAPVVNFRLQRQTELAKRSSPPRQYYVVDEAVIRRHVGISQDPAIMPNQLRSIADRVKSDERLTFRVIPFRAGAHRGLGGPFTLLEFDGAMPDILYIDLGRESTLITGTDSRIGEYADDFEVLLESALTAAESVELMRQVAEEMSLSRARGLLCSFLTSLANQNLTGIISSIERHRLRNRRLCRHRRANQDRLHSYRGMSTRSGRHRPAVPCRLDTLIPGHCLT